MSFFQIIWRKGRKMVGRVPLWVFLFAGDGDKEFPHLGLSRSSSFILYNMAL